MFVKCISKKQKLPYSMCQQMKIKAEKTSNVSNAIIACYICLGDNHVLILFDLYEFRESVKHDKSNISNVNELNLF